MSLYPTLEGMVIDQMMRAQSAYERTTENEEGEVVYPKLGAYMGLEFSEEVIRENMPEYLPVQMNTNSGTSLSPAQNAGGFIRPSSLNSRQLSHDIRQIVLCKDADGKVGLRTKSIDKGVFVCIVIKSSPAAMGGLRFGDQILQINGENVAGYSEKKVHDIFKKAGVNNIVLAVRDRPFERCLSLHKDSFGHLGFQYKDGKINSIAINSSAARNGLLIGHNLLEVNGQNVVGMKDKEIGNLITEAGNVVTLTVIPSFMFEHMMKNMSDSLVKKLMDHSYQDI